MQLAEEEETKRPKNFGLKLVDHREVEEDVTERLLAVRKEQALNNYKVNK